MPWIQPVTPFLSMNGFAPRMMAETWSEGRL